MCALLLYCLLINCTIVLVGYKLAKNHAIVASWMILFAVVGLACFIAFQANPIVKMLLTIITIFSCMKVIVLTQTYQKKIVKIRFGRWLLFAIGWAGMRIQPFETVNKSGLSHGWTYILFGISRLIAGLAMISLAHWIIILPLSPQVIFTLTSIVLLIGFSLMLHFGLLSINAGIWQMLGVNVNLLFKQPLKATSLAEFWGKRWNIAFSEMTSLTIYKPLKIKYGESTGLIASFVFSGLLHELALSFPVNCGYGLPLLYFAIQGIMVTVERLLLRHSYFFNNRLSARIWTFVWIVVPAPLLFNSQFLKQIIWSMACLNVR